MHTKRFSIAVLFLSVVGMAFFSCKDMGSVAPKPAPTTTPISFSTQVQPIFTISCVNAGCHPGGGAPFSLASGVSRGNLVGVDMVNSACGGKRVLAGDANASGLIKKLEGNCGARMPLGGAALSSAEITLIRDWISQGAQNN